jgi:penicillin-binding protein 1B
MSFIHKLRERLALLKVAKNINFELVKKLLLISFLLFFVFSIFAYVKIDSLVKKRLNQRDSGSLAAAYSAPIIINASQQISRAALINRLISRTYRPSAAIPDKPGYYKCTNDFCWIFTRKFIASDGKDVEGSLINYRFFDGKISDTKENSLNSFWLEPVIISPLGGTNSRASTFEKLNEFPPHLVKAVLSVEDRRFYKHLGIDPLGIMRAIGRNFLSFKLVEGGSTITQQLAKNILFSPQKTIIRKVREAFAALSLERRLSKEEILTMYLNEVYFSQEGAIAVHGVPEAAKVFFGKKTSALTISESALLAGMIRAPSYYSPRNHLARSIERRNTVLSEMLSQKVISESEYQSAVTEKIEISKQNPWRKKAPFFMAHLEQDLRNRFQLDWSGSNSLSIHTFIDEALQQCAETSVTSGVARLEKSYPNLIKGDKRIELSLVALDTKTGGVLAWVGGRDFSLNQFDHVSQARRQIGSTIKPFLYLTAIDPDLNSYKVATPISILGDEPTKISVVNQGDWEPNNYDKKYRGDVTLRYALEKSLNLPAVYVAQRVGIKQIVRTLESFRVAENIPNVPSVALGSVETSLLNLTAAFGALANLGLYSTPRTFTTVLNPDAEVIATELPKRFEIASAGPTYIIVDILRGVIERGTASLIRSMGFKYPAAGKTGTSNNARDSWFVGFTPEIVVGVWSGFDDNRATQLTGGNATAPIWGEFMKCASPYLNFKSFLPPNSVNVVTLDRRNMKRPLTSCLPHPSYRVQEIFLKGTEPPFECFESEIERNRNQELQRRRNRPSGSIWDKFFNWE